MIIGLTGTIGAGKSTVASLFAARSYAVIDCDGISHGLNDDAGYVAEVGRRFCGVVTDGKLDRAALAKIVFADAEKLAELESIAFPFITRRVICEIENYKSLGKDIVLDAPTLFRAGLEGICDLTVGVIAERETRIERILSRGGISRESAEARIASQPGDEFFRERCDFTLDNSGGIAELSDKFDLLINKITLWRTK